MPPRGATTDALRQTHAVYLSGAPTTQSGLERTPAPTCQCCLWGGIVLQEELVGNIRSFCDMLVDRECSALVLAMRARPRK